MLMLIKAAVCFIVTCSLAFGDGQCLSSTAVYFYY